MAPSSASRAFVAALILAALSAAPAVAQTGPRTLVVYPVAAASGAAADASDVTSLLDAALRRVIQRTEEIALAEPLFVRGTCGPAPTAQAACLAGLPGGGLVLRVIVHRSQSIMVVQLEAVDAKARSFGPVTVSVDAFAQSSEPLVRAVLILVDQVGAGSRRPELRAGVPLPPPPRLVERAAPPAAEKPAPPAAEKPAPPAAVKPSLAVAPPPPPAARERAPIAAVEKPSAPAGPRGAWMRTAGPLLTGTGAAVLAGGIALSVMNRSLSNELDRKFAAGTLTPSDLASYRRVERNNRMTQILFGAGGALTLGGVAVWTAAPARDTVVAGASGRF